MKNHADALIFQSRVCDGATNSESQMRNRFREFLIAVPTQKCFGMEVNMTIQQEAYEKIMRLPEDGIRLILVMADEIARQHGIFASTDSLEEKNVLLPNKKKAFQNMLEMRGQSTYPIDFDYKKVMEEAVNEKYKFIT